MNDNNTLPTTTTTTTSNPKSTTSNSDGSPDIDMDSDEAVAAVEVDPSSKTTTTTTTTEDDQKQIIALMETTTTTTTTAIMSSGSDDLDVEVDVDTTNRKDDSQRPQPKAPPPTSSKSGTTNTTDTTTTTTTQVAGPGPGPATSSSEVVVPAPVTVPVVTTKRKIELLKKARHVRRIWIQKAILPFDHTALALAPTATTTTTTANTGEVDSSSNSSSNEAAIAVLWTMSGNEAMQLVQSSTICRRRPPHVGAKTTTTTSNSSAPPPPAPAAVVGEEETDDKPSLSLLPSATPVLSELYGHHHGGGGGSSCSGLLTLDQVGERVEKLVQPFLDEENERKKQEAAAYSSDDPTTTPSTISLLSSPTTPNISSSSSSSTIIVKSYHDLLSKLLLPESALLVQGIRNFILQWQGRWKKSPNTTTVSYDIKQQAASAINAYIQSTVDSLPRSHVAWKNDRRMANHDGGGENKDGDKENENDPTSTLSIRRSMESFVYNHAYNHIINHLLVVVVTSSSLKEKHKPQTLSEKKRDDDDDEAGVGNWTLSQESFDMKLDELKFIQPSHLEIACLKDDNDGDNNKVEDNNQQNSLDTLLAEPIEALLSMDMYYSPFEKLQRVLALYKAVNTSLSTALNAARDQNDKLPSADDILPTIILVCIKARPANLLRNLEFIETFAKPEYLRGEAGYAYTNLYGAVQFLMDLKMDETAAGSTLSITPEQLKYHLSESRETTENKRQSVLAAASGGTGHGVDDKILNALSRSDAGIPPFDVSEASLNLSVHDVRAARLNGETIDISWAIKASETNRSSSSDTFHLPDGFSRSYGFLGADPQDIRVADLPNLLQEYRLLAEVTEGLLSQQAARAAHEKKQRDLHRQAALAEEMLLLGMPSTS